MGGFVDRWPRTAANTIIVVCPQGEKMIVERLGKMHSIQEPGFFFAIPLIDRIAYRIDMRERTLEIAPQAAITKDNVRTQTERARLRAPCAAIICGAPHRCLSTCLATCMSNSLTQSVRRTDR